MAVLQACPAGSFSATGRTPCQVSCSHACCACCCCATLTFCCLLLVLAPPTCTLPCCALCLLQPCLPGQFSNATGATACQACPAGTASGYSQPVTSCEVGVSGSI